MTDADHNSEDYAAGYDQGRADAEANKPQPLTLDRIRRMSPAEINARKAEVNEVLRASKAGQA